MKYDAFISYRHGELDGLVAEKLHKMLETYHIPAAIARKTGKKRLRRIFRDREELPTSSNLSGSINDALEHSEFLLLICSPRLLESKWCMREVELFSRLHGKDRIISLLIDGEPDEAFPPGIRFREIDGQKVEVEPLAADIRADTWKGSLKLLKTEKLRLLAPLLGCAYDDLRQRHRARRRRIAATVTGAVLAGSLGFGSFSTYQFLQIQQQMQWKLENQSYVLAAYSEEALADGDPELAALLALEALPQSLHAPERPYVKTAEMALAKALGVYDTGGGFQPYKTVTLPAAPGALLLSPSETYAAALYTYELRLFTPETGREAATLKTAASVLSGAVFLSDRVIVFSGEEGLCAYDIAEGRVLWVGEETTALALSGDGSLIAALTPEGDNVLFYTPGGEKTGEISFDGRHCPLPPKDAFLNPCDFAFALNGDGSRLALSFADGSLSLFTTGEGETVLYPPSAAIHFAGGFFEDFFAFSVVEQAPYAASYAVYDTEQGRFTLQLGSQSARFVPLACEDGLYFANENQIYAVDGAQGSISPVASVGERIITLQKSGDIFLVCDNAGGYHFIGEEVNTYASGYTCDFALIGASFALTGGYDSETVRIVKKRESTMPALFAYDPAYAFSEARWDGEGLLLYSYRGFRSYAADGTLHSEVIFPEPEKVTDTRYDRGSGHLAVLYQDALRLYSSRDGTLLLEQAGAKGKDSVCFTDFGIHVMEENGRVLLFDLPSATVLGEESVPAGADFALLLGNALYGMEGRVFYGEREIGAGAFLGGTYRDDGRYAFALAEGGEGRVFTLGPEGLREVFAFPLRGAAEAFFTGDFVFIAERRGAVTAYRMDGSVARGFSEEGYVAETELSEEGILMHLISASAGRYSLLLDGKTLDAGAYLPGLLDRQEDGALLFDDGNGELRLGRVYEGQELQDLAQIQLDGRVLSADERVQYRAS